jgi:pyruvate formate lyase activating enzyme
MHAARHWKHDEKVAGRVVCNLCPHECVIAEGKAGFCLGRRNIGGELVAASYGEVVSIAVDPIEKKPLYHFLPGSDILSVATYGCNLRCPFCQNAEISQQVAPSRHVEPDELLALAKCQRASSIAYTYNEPCIWFEYLMDTGKLMQEAGIRNVLVTNGMLNPEPLAELLPLVSAMNIDLKSIQPEFYRDYVKGDLDTVLSTIQIAAKACHVELTNLLIPGRNDSDSDISELVDFVARLGRTTVLHFSRYFPRHRASEAPTPAETLARAGAIARKKLAYVYLGNVTARPEDRDTFCPKCRNLLVERSEYAGRIVGIRDGKCANCERTADFVLD